MLSGSENTVDGFYYIDAFVANGDIWNDKTTVGDRVWNCKYGSWVRYKKNTRTGVYAVEDTYAFHSAQFALCYECTQYNLLAQTKLYGTKAINGSGGTPYLEMDGITGWYTPYTLAQNLASDKSTSGIFGVKDWHVLDGHFPGSWGAHHWGYQVWENNLASMRMPPIFRSFNHPPYTQFDKWHYAANYRDCVYDLSYHPKNAGSYGGSLRSHSNPKLIMCS